MLRARSERLEAWYAPHLRAIAERRTTLATNPTHATQSPQPTPKPEPTPMNESQAAPINVDVAVHSGGGSWNQASGHGQAHQHNLTAPQDELLPLLSRLLNDTASAVPHSVDLRRACREAQGELEETAALSAPTKNWLRRSIEELPAADKAVGVATKVADPIGRIPGLGA